MHKRQKAIVSSELKQDIPITSYLTHKIMCKWHGTKRIKRMLRALKIHNIQKISEQEAQYESM